jgi:hypothetical protein
MTSMSGSASTSFTSLMFFSSGSRFPGSIPSPFTTSLSVSRLSVLIPSGLLGPGLILLVSPLSDEENRTSLPFSMNFSIKHLNDRHPSV